MKTSRWLMVLGLALLVSVAGCGPNDEGAQSGTQQPRRQLETVKANEDDGQIYRNVEAFINALVKDDRNTVLAMLTKDHRNSWSENSFLLNAETKNQFEEFGLENLNYTVVKYVNNEDTNFVETAFIVAAYDVVMKNDGAEAGRVKLQETLAFHKEDGQWGITVNERGILVSQ